MKRTWDFHNPADVACLLGYPVPDPPAEKEEKEDEK
jgi:hypothetical protein